VDAVVGAETAGVPLAASIALQAGLPFAFVRKPGYTSSPTCRRRSTGC
jgi:orotate phosphoribosyltransferase